MFFVECLNEMTKLHLLSFFKKIAETLKNALYCMFLTAEEIKNNNRNQDIQITMTRTGRSMG